MNEDKTGKLIKESLLHPSDQFTDELMQKVEAYQRIRNLFTRVFTLSCFGCALFLFFVFVIKIPTTIDLLKFHVKLPPLSIKVAGIVFVLVIFNRLLMLREKLLTIK